MYDVKYTSRFKKDYKRLKKRGWDMDKLLDAIDILRSGLEMPPEYNDHPLRGDYEGHRDCHIERTGFSYTSNPSRRWSFP
jgi:mRNA interferase YafQ